MARATEVIRNLRLVQAFTRESQVERAFRRGSQDVVRTGLAFADLNTRREATAAILVAVGATLILWIGAGTVLAGQMTTGQLLVLLIYVKPWSARRPSCCWTTPSPVWTLSQRLESWPPYGALPEFARRCWSPRARPLAAQADRTVTLRDGRIVDATPTQALAAAESTQQT